MCRINTLPYVGLGLTVRVPQPPLKAVKVGPAPEGTPLVYFQDKTKPPQKADLPTKPLIKLPSLDVTTPLPIPILAQPTKDRASLGESGVRGEPGGGHEAAFTPTSAIGR